MESREQIIQKEAQIQLLTKVFKQDQTCFKKCIKVAEKRLTEDQEKCLKICNNKVQVAYDFLHKLNDKVLE
ncbi:unnamed protein product (macronuclear) [Paramecium tetraurelia]|uniref:Mitochondrial import inner membrane translocase subunit n=1 Tax=Paramecium tetraurelia TaxID=5888 RepID=A0DG94_PARTE|nr:uncharacterized protein GSPATT00002190001 [Paramecium tetraurelia]CAK82061.1 unnamed protein product [Paramecium tetraurelia]|eukprot:XP_001449458.1 hypothetical protein (macronuclear) [Paramecium tetraurelia strain d4-2]